MNSPGRINSGTFDESGEVRALYSTDRGASTRAGLRRLPTSIESRVAFQRDAAGAIVSLTWQREGARPRTARRAGLSGKKISASPVAAFNWQAR